MLLATGAQVSRFFSLTAQVSHPRARAPTDKLNIASQLGVGLKYNPQGWATGEHTSGPYPCLPEVCSPCRQI